MDKKKPYSLWDYAHYFRPYIGTIVLGMIFLIGAKVASTIEPIYLQKIIDGLSSREPLKIIINFLIIGFALQLATNLAQLIRDYIMAPVIMGVTRDIEKAVFDKLLKLQVSYHADQQAGAAARAVARGTRAISFVLDFSISELLPPVFELFFVTFVLLKLFTWEYAIITLVTIVTYTVFTIWSTEKRQRYRRLGNEEDDKATGIMMESVGHIDTIKYFNTAERQFSLFMHFKEKWFVYWVKNNKMFAAVYSVQGIILMVGLGVILTLAILQAYDGLMTAGSLVLVSTYLIRLSIPISSLGFVYGQFKNSFSDLEAMGKILRARLTIEEPKNPLKPAVLKGQVVFQNVSFQYEDGKEPVLKNINIKINPGQKIAFVGPSGAGKSTIVKLVFRLFETTKGKVLIDDIDVRRLSSRMRKKILAIVPQDPALFNDTVANNIKFGANNCTMKDVENAAKAAQIHDFIVTMPQKYNTKVGERGVKLSGGQRQRIAIARAIIKNPKVLVFDEATSSLDSKSESAILSTLNKIAKGRTTITIAHRLSTITNSDVIYVLKNGVISESGTHSQLLQKNDTYARLWRVQSKAK